MAGRQRGAASGIAKSLLFLHAPRQPLSPALVLVSGWPCSLLSRPWSWEARRNEISPRALAAASMAATQASGDGGSLAPSLPGAAPSSSSLSCALHRQGGHDVCKSQLRLRVSKRACCPLQRKAQTTYVRPCASPTAQPARPPQASCSPSRPMLLSLSTFSSPVARAPASLRRPAALPPTPRPAPAGSAGAGRRQRKRAGERGAWPAGGKGRTLAAGSRRSPLDACSPEAAVQPWHRRRGRLHSCTAAQLHMPERQFSFSFSPPGRRVARACPAAGKRPAAR